MKEMFSWSKLMDEEEFEQISKRLQQYDNNEHLVMELRTAYVNQKYYFNILHMALDLLVPLDIISRIAHLCPEMMIVNNNDNNTDDDPPLYHSPLRSALNLEFEYGDEGFALFKKLVYLAPECMFTHVNKSTVLHFVVDDGLLGSPRSNKFVLLYTARYWRVLDFIQKRGSSIIPRDVFSRYILPRVKELVPNLGGVENSRKEMPLHQALGLNNQGHCSLPTEYLELLIEFTPEYVLYHKDENGCTPFDIAYDCHAHHSIILSLKRKKVYPHHGNEHQ